jgi:hypothetical protein
MANSFKQVFINQKIFADTTLKDLQEGKRKRESACGILLGRREPGEKASIYDVVLTPDPEESQEDLKKLAMEKGLPVP